MVVDRIPDLPRNVEGRGLLVEARADLVLSDSGGVIVGCAEDRLIVSVGEPGAALVDEAAARAATGWVWIAPPEDPRLTRILSGWRWEPAVVHQREHALEPPARDVRALHASDRLDHLDADLVEELERARRRVAVFAAFVGGRAVSFAYAPVRSETWFDVSVDTDVEHRNRGLAAACAAALFAHEHEGGRRPVWGALASNAPSLAVARRLGFAPCDRLIIFTREAR